MAQESRSEVGEILSMSWKILTMDGSLKDWGGVQGKCNLQINILALQAIWLPLQCWTSWLGAQSRFSQTRPLQWHISTIRVTQKSFRGQRSREDSIMGRTSHFQPCLLQANYFSQQYLSLGERSLHQEVFQDLYHR